MDFNVNNDQGYGLRHDVLKIGSKLIKDIEGHGYSKEVAMTALCFNGCQSLRLVSQWISSHLLDRLMYLVNEVDFRVFLTLGDQIRMNVVEFIDEVRGLVGWDYVSDYPPAIPIIHLKVNYHDVLTLYDIYIKTFGSLDFKLPSSVFATTFTADSDVVSLKIIISNEYLLSFLQKISSAFVVKISEAGIKVRVVSDENVSAHHLEIVRHCVLPSEVIETVERLKDTYLNHNILNQFVELGFNLYTHDPRINTAVPEIYRMQTFVEADLCQLRERPELCDIDRRSSDECPIEAKENIVGNIASSDDSNRAVNSLLVIDSKSILSHLIGDYVLVVGSASSPDNKCMGCPVGLNLSTGLTGLFHLIAGRRVPQYLTWTLYCSLKLISSQDKRSSDGSCIELNPSIHYPVEQYTNHCHKSQMHNRQLFIMRHGERVDMCFNRAWPTQHFDQKGIYHRVNLNYPPVLPIRANCLEYTTDQPLTQIGLFVSRETGRALSEAGVKFTACYSSPALRCVQTASEVLRGMGRSDMLIRIEPHLFEWFGWWSTCLPKWMTPNELSKCGYPVDVNYHSFSSVHDVNVNETVTQFYERNAAVIKNLLNVHKSKSTCLLIVAHACSLDTCTRQLIHHSLKPNLTVDDLNKRTLGVPHCGLILAEENRRWALVDPSIPNVCSHSYNPEFNWKQFLA